MKTPIKNSLLILLVALLLLCYALMAMGSEEDDENAPRTNTTASTIPSASGEESKTNEQGKTTAQSTNSSTMPIETELTAADPMHDPHLSVENGTQTLYFGRYKQSSNTQQQIEWIVLAKSGNMTLLLSKYALDSQAYNTTFSNGTWDKCSLRTWLNNDFYNTAFNESEKAQIQKTIVKADKNPYSTSTNSGNDTEDNVFILSTRELELFFPNTSKRNCLGTNYAFSRGLMQPDGCPQNSCHWWLRSPGDKAPFVCIVAAWDLDGIYYSTPIDNETGVRPAIWVELQE